MSEFAVLAEALDRLGPEDQRRVGLALEELKRARSENPLSFYNLPSGPVPVHQQQLVFHAAQTKYKAFLGGNRSGKTTAGIADDLIQAVDPEVLPAHLLPYKRWYAPFFCRIMCPDLTNNLEGVILRKFREWCPRSQLRGGSFDKAWDKQLRVLRFENGSYFQIMSYDQDLDKMGGSDLHRVHFDEEPPLAVWNENQMRLADHDGDSLLTMTPVQGLTWTYDGIWGRRDEPKFTVVTVDMDDNPHLSGDGKAAALEGLSTEERAARKEGRFVALHGLVYSEFRPGLHVIPSRGAQGDIYVGIDPGIRHMNAVVWVEADEHGHLTVLEELALKDAPIAQVCKAIQERNAVLGISPRWYVIDPAARNRNMQTGRSDQMEFADHGVVTIPGQNAIAAGIHRIKNFLTETDEGRPWLTMTANCDILIEEFRRYRWSKPRLGENEPAEKTVKRDDHLLDALRYVIMSRPSPSEIRRPGRFAPGSMEAKVEADLEATSREKAESNFGPGIYQ